MWQQKFFVLNHKIYNFKDLESVLKRYGFAAVSAKQAIIAKWDEIT